MKIRKPDEMEKHHNAIASRNGFVFYAAVLLIWSIYSQIITGNGGWPFTILLGGNMVFLGTRTYYDHKTK